MAHDGICKDLAKAVADIAKVQRLNRGFLINHELRTDCTIRTAYWSRWERKRTRDNPALPSPASGGKALEGGHNLSREGAHSRHEVFDGRAKVGADVFRSRLLEGLDLRQDGIRVADE